MPHLNPALLLTPPDLMLEVAKIEIGVQFPVHTAKQVLVERSRDTRRVVIGCEHTCYGFDQIGSINIASPSCNSVRTSERNAAAAGRSKLPIVLPRNKRSKF